MQLLKVCVLCDQYVHMGTTCTYTPPVAANMQVTQRGLTINMAQSIAIMHQPVSLLTYLKRVMRCRDDAQLEQELSRENSRKKASRAVSGMMVCAQRSALLTSHPLSHATSSPAMQIVANFQAAGGVAVPKRQSKAKQISNRSANSYRFDFTPRGQPDNVENISVAEYYRRMYGVNLRFPNMPLVSTGGRRETAMPLELFSIVPGLNCVVAVCCGCCCSFPACSPPHRPAP